jgi:DUF4097 and DUF4098 domain-containing protein YvlB
MPVFDTPGSVALQIRLSSGRVVVTTSDEPRTSVDVISVGRHGEEAAEDVLVRAEERKGGHVVTVEQRDKVRWGPFALNWGGKVEVLVTCPHGADLELSGASTTFRAEGRYGRVSVKTASGDLELGTVAGKLDVKTASGDVEIEAVESDGSVVTVSGDLEIARVDGALNVRTVSGDTKFGPVTRPLTVATTSGDVEAKALAGGDARVQTTSGDVRVAVASGTRVWIDATSVSGDLRSELALGDAPEEGAGDVVPVNVRTVSGDVSIVRADARVTTPR